VSETSTPERALLASRGSTSRPEARLGVSDVVDLLSMSTIKSTGAKAETTTRRTSSPSAESTTTNNTEFSGTEPLDFVLSLPKDTQRKWVVMRLAAYQEAMVLYATLAQQAKDRGKSVSEAEWEAILGTDGITRAVPQEQHIYAWIMGVK
jgi:hypothetical protein